MWKSTSICFRVVSLNVEYIYKYYCNDENGGTATWHKLWAYLKKEPLITVALLSNSGCDKMLCCLTIENDLNENCLMYRDESIPPFWIAHHVHSAHMGLQVLLLSFHNLLHSSIFIFDPLEWTDLMGKWLAA